MKTHQQPLRLKKQQGFTLIELLVAVVIAGVLLAIGVPSYQQFVKKSQLSASANNVITTLNFARSEAIKRSVQVTIRHKGGTPQLWEDGWDVFTDLNANGTFNDDADATLCEPGEDCLLLTRPPLPASLTLRSGSNYGTWVAYLASGLTKASSGTANDTFRLCSGTDSVNSKSIHINISGRPRTTTGTASCP